MWLCVEEDLSIPEEMRIAAKQGKTLPGKVDRFKHLATFINDGATGYKIDPGRTLDEHADRKYYNGLTDAEMHQVQQVLVAKKMFNSSVRKQIANALLYIIAAVIVPI